MVYNPRRSERGRPQQSWDRDESTLLLHEKRNPWAINPGFRSAWFSEYRAEVAVMSAV